MAYLNNLLQNEDANKTADSNASISASNAELHPVRRLKRYAISLGSLDHTHTKGENPNRK